MEPLNIYLVLSCLCVSAAQVWIPKREVGFVFKGGSPAAQIKVDAFLDLLCPDSKRTFQTLRTVADHYGQDKVQLRVHLFPLPFHYNAFVAAKGAFVINQLTGGNRTFDWMMMMFDNRVKFTNGNTYSMTAMAIQREMSSLASNLGVSKNEFHRLMTSNTDIELQARLGWKYGCTRAIHSTPMTMVNDILLNVANTRDLSVDAWKAVIDPLLSASG